MTTEQNSISDDGGLRNGLSRRTFLGGSAAVGAATLVARMGAAHASPPNAAAKTGLKVGAGKAVITPGSLLPLDGFTSVHDDIYVRVLLVESATKKIALVVLDLTSISEEAITDMRTAISQATGVYASDIMVTVTHSFSSPHVMPSSQSAQAAAWVQLLVSGTTTAANAAVKNLQDAQVGYGQGKADVNVNRNVLTSGGWWLGVNEQLPSDKSVYVARFDDLDGNPIAILTNYNVQSCVMQDSVMNDGTLPITADLAGAAVSHVESQYPSAVGFWLVGACGDQFPGYRSKRYTIDKDRNWSYGIDLHDAGFALLTTQGERMGNEIVRVAASITRFESGPKTAVQLINHDLTVKLVSPPHVMGPVTTATYPPAGTSSFPLWVFQIGSGGFAGVSPELSTDTASDIRDASPFDTTFVMSMFEGGAKNMPEASQYPQFTYEALDGFYAQGTAERVAKVLDRLLSRLD